MSTIEINYPEDCNTDDLALLHPDQFTGIRTIKVDDPDNHIPWIRRCVGLRTHLMRDSQPPNRSKHTSPSYADNFLCYEEPIELPDGTLVKIKGYVSVLPDVGLGVALVRTKRLRPDGRTYVDSSNRTIEEYVGNAGFRHKRRTGTRDGGTLDIVRTAESTNGVDSTIAKIDMQQAVVYAGENDAIDKGDGWRYQASAGVDGVTTLQINEPGKTSRQWRPDIERFALNVTQGGTVKQHLHWVGQPRRVQAAGNYVFVQSDCVVELALSLEGFYEEGVLQRSAVFGTKHGEREHRASIIFCVRRQAGSVIQSEETREDGENSDDLLEQVAALQDEHVTLSDEVNLLRKEVALTQTLVSVLSNRVKQVGQSRTTAAQLRRK